MTLRFETEVPHRRRRWALRRRHASSVICLSLALAAGGGPVAAQDGPFDGWERKPLVEWMAIGAAEATGATIKLRIRGDAREVRVAASQHPHLRDPVLSSIASSNEDVDDGLSTVRLEGLEPDTRYALATLVDGKVDTARPGRLRTLPAGPASFRVVASADISPSGVENQVFPTILNLDPLLLLTVGDVIDHALDVGDLEDAREHWRIFQESRTMGELLAAVPWAHMWDDHDYGKNDGARNFKHRWAARQIYQETFAPLPASPARSLERCRDRAGLLDRARAAS